MDTSEVAFVGIDGDCASGRATIRWSVLDATDVRGYNVYRRDFNGGGFELVTPIPVPALREGRFHDDSVEQGHRYGYRVTAVASDGEWWSPTISISVPAASMELLQNYPNPFNPSTTISFVLPERSAVRLSVYDVTGALVKTLVISTFEAGRNAVTWDGRDARGNRVGAGVYFYRLVTVDETFAKKMVLIK
jgi:hypothetical protein